MIRVLQVLHGMDCGGAENMIMNLYRHIDRTQVQFDFLVHTEKKCFFDDEIKELGGNIYHVPYYNIKNHFSYKKALNIFFSNHPEIKIVHGHLGSCAHIYLSIAKKYGCFAIVHSHNTKPQGISVKNILYCLFTYKTRKIADFFFGCSMAAAEYRFGTKISRSDRCSVLKNAIEIEKFVFSEENRRKIRKELNLEDKFVIGHVGRFDIQKNHVFLIDVFKIIHEKKPNAVLVLVGDGMLREKIELKVRCLGLEKNVVFTGVRSDVPSLLSAMDAFIFPSLYEGLGIVAVEAQTSGLPTFCSSAVPEEANVSELFVKIFLEKPASDWAEKILEKTESCCREKYYVDAINAGYDIHSTADWLELLYKNICG